MAKNNLTMKIYIGIAALIIVLASIIGVQCQRIKTIKTDRDIYESNTNVLLQETKAYKTKDSLNALSVGQLKLSIKEFQKYRADDAKFIASLKVDNKRLQQVTTAQIQTIYELKGTVRDSFIYVNNVVFDSLKCLTIVNKWFDLDGCINNNKDFSGRIITRESLLYVEHIVPKHFLFIKWGCKERRQEIISKNPNTQILKAEFITIRD